MCYFVHFNFPFSPYKKLPISDLKISAIDSKPHCNQQNIWSYSIFLVRAHPCCIGTKACFGNELLAWECLQSKSTRGHLKGALIGSVRQGEASVWLTCTVTQTLIAVWLSNPTFPHHFVCYQRQSHGPHQLACLSLTQVGLPASAQHLRRDFGIPLC